MIKSLFESTTIHTKDGTQVAVSRYQKGQQVITMLVSKDEYEALKNQQATTDNGGSADIATAETIINDWVDNGAEVYWKTAADHNRIARDLENHRFRNNPEVSQNFDAHIDDSRSKARQAMKDNMRAVESITFKDFLLLS